MAMTMVWNVFSYDINRKSIVTYNIFDHDSFAQDVKKLLKKDISKQSFDNELMGLLFYYFGCKAEYEIGITSWPVYIDREELNRLNTEYKEHNNKWGCYPHRIDAVPEVGEKVDIYSQVTMNFNNFADYVLAHKDAKLTQLEFYEKHCSKCGSQRCEGINTEWFDGCKYKDELRV